MIQVKSFLTSWTHVKNFIIIFTPVKVFHNVETAHGERIFKKIAFYNFHIFFLHFKENCNNNFLHFLKLKSMNFFVSF